MEAVTWFLLIGAALLAVSLAHNRVQRLPLSMGMLYLVAGFAIGRWGPGRLDVLRDAHLLERATELAVILSLFTCGLKLRPAITLANWHVPLRLAFVSMALTVGAIALVGVYGLGLDWGHAILLGAILSPTDPVLASEVQVERPGDTDRLRFGLTGEAGLNDGTAFPFVMLGLGLIGRHDLGEHGLRWLGVDVVWAVLGGIGIGFGLGTLVGRLVVHLRTRHREALGTDDFIALGLIALSYGLALLVHAYGFLAVFSAGLALRRIEARAASGEPDREVADQAQVGKREEIATHPEKGAAFMTEAVLGFNEQLERISEFALMMIVGMLLASMEFSVEAWWFIPLLFLVIRPLAVCLGLLGTKTPGPQYLLISWFGVRGIGSLYYLFYAATHGLDAEKTRWFASGILSVIAASVLVHGTSVTPAMARYARWRERSPHA
jgi:NhaP-type Na+/H+ or K+/H+ antiporter